MRWWQTYKKKWLLNCHWGREMWAIMEMPCRSPRNHNPGRRHPAAPSLENEVWWIKCAEASTNPPPVSCTHQWNSFHVRPRGPADTSTLTTRLCSLNTFWWSRVLTGKHAPLRFNQPLVGRALRLSKWVALHRTEPRLSHSAKAMKCRKVKKH